MAISDTINSMKEHVQSAYSQIESMNGTVPTNKNLENLAGAIGTIKTGVDTSDATATEADLLAGKTAYANGAKITGTIETYEGDGSETVNKLASLVDGSLNEITAEDLAGIRTIRSYAFYYSQLLKSVSIPDTVYSIGDYAFYSCTALENINIPPLVSMINQNVFYSCTSLKSIVLPDRVTYIDNSAFYNCNKLENINIPDGVTTIGQSAFNACKSLTNIVLPNSVTSIGNNAFYDCTSLETINIPDGITRINGSIFYNCSAIKTIIIPNGVTRIDNYAFYGCTSLTNLTIPSGVTSINYNALEIGSSTNKATITMLPTTPPTIQSSTFNASYLQKIIVPAGTGATYKAATNWSNFADYIEEATA